MLRAGVTRCGVGTRHAVAELVQTTLVDYVKRALVYMYFCRQRTLSGIHVFRALETNAFSYSPEENRCPKYGGYEQDSIPADFYVAHASCTVIPGATFFRLVVETVEDLCTGVCRPHISSVAFETLQLAVERHVHTILESARRLNVREVLYATNIATVIDIRKSVPVYKQHHAVRPRLFPAMLRMSRLLRGTARLSHPILVQLENIVIVFGNAIADRARDLCTARKTVTITRDAISGALNLLDAQFVDELPGSPIVFQRTKALSFLRKCKGFRISLQALGMMVHILASLAMILIEASMERKVSSIQDLRECIECNVALNALVRTLNVDIF